MRKYILHLIVSFFYLSGFSQVANYQLFDNINLRPDANVAVCFIQDHQGMIWIGTDKGLVSYDGYSLQPYFSYGERSNSRIHCGIAVNDKYLLLGTDNGLFIYNYLTDKYEEPDVDFPSNVVTSPDIVQAELSKRPVILTALYVNNELMNPDEDNSIRYTGKLTLNYQQNNLLFKISDLPYALEEKNKFAYRKSIDDEWNLLRQNSNEIVYNNLSYGNYLLEVTKLGIDGNPVDNGYKLNINVNPPWYYTIWAKLFYLPVGISLVLGVIHFFKVKNRLDFERIEKERIMDQSKSKLDFFSNISHDLKTPLSMIIAPASKMLLEFKNKPEKKRLETIQRNAMKLNSLIHQMLDFNRIDNSENSFLIVSRVEFISFAKNLFAVFEEGSKKEKNLTFFFEANQAKLYMDIDVVKFDSILNNLFSNSYKYTPEGGNITLSIKVKEEQRELEIKVSDTGIGIPQQDLPHIFQRFFQSRKTQGKKEGTGIGLYLAKTYAELHSGNITAVSQEGAGTSVILTMPLQHIESGADIVEPESSALVGKPLIERYDCEVMVCEVGMSWDSAEAGELFLLDLLTQSKNIPDNKCLGIFWWEPQVSASRNGYTKGAFDDAGKPTVALDAFRF